MKLKICYIEADISNVKELIRIFIENAIKYTKENGKIDIYSKIENGKIYINIKDNGIGIAKSIANVNGAEIKLESELNKGSNFILIFKEYKR